MDKIKISFHTSYRIQRHGKQINKSNNKKTQKQQQQNQQQKNTFLFGITHKKLKKNDVIF